MTRIIKAISKFLTGVLWTIVVSIRPFLTSSEHNPRSDTRSSDVEPIVRSRVRFQRSSNSLRSTSLHTKSNIKLHPRTSSFTHHLDIPQQFPNYQEPPPLLHITLISLNSFLITKNLHIINQSHSDHQESSPCLPRKRWMRTPFSSILASKTTMVPK